MILAAEILIVWLLASIFLAGIWIAFVTLGRTYITWRNQRLINRRTRARGGYLYQRRRLP